MAVTPLNVRPEDRFYAWALAAFLCAGYGVYCGYVVYQAVDLNNNPTTRYEVVTGSTFQFPLVYVCPTTEVRLGSLDSLSCCYTHKTSSGADICSASSPDASPGSFEQCCAGSQSFEGVCTVRQYEMNVDSSTESVTFTEQGEDSTVHQGKTWLDDDSWQLLGMYSWPGEVLNGYCSDVQHNFFVCNNKITWQTNVTFEGDTMLDLHRRWESSFEDVPVYREYSAPGSMALSRDSQAISLLHPTAAQNFNDMAVCGKSDWVTGQMYQLLDMNCGIQDITAGCEGDWDIDWTFIDNCPRELSFFLLHDDELLINSPSCVAAEISYDDILALEADAENPLRMVRVSSSVDDVCDDNDLEGPSGEPSDAVECFYLDLGDAQVTDIADAGAKIYLRGMPSLQRDSDAQMVDDYADVYLLENDGTTVYSRSIVEQSSSKVALMGATQATIERQVFSPLTGSDVVKYTSRVSTVSTARRETEKTDNSFLFGLTIEVPEVAYVKITERGAEITSVLSSFGGFWNYVIGIFSVMFVYSGDQRQLLYRKFALRRWFQSEEDRKAELQMEAVGERCVHEGSGRA